jgi:putative transposase
MIYKSVYQSQTEDGESMTADTLHEDDPTTNTGVCKRVKEDSLDAVAALEAFVETYQIKYERATDCLTKDRDALLAFYDFPAEHWEHLRTTNPIESTFASVRHRTIRSKGCLSNKTALAMVFKLVEGAQKNWRRIDGHNQLPKLIQGVKFADGIEVIGNSAVSQAQAAA